MMAYKLLCFNIRIDVPDDGIQSWSYRRELVSSFLIENNADIIGFQEVGPHMYAFLKERLIAYDSFCVSRDERGESTPIFYRKGLFDILEMKTIWLTETPHITSYIFGSNHPRIATYIVFKDKNKQVFAFFNTHLDYTGDEVTYKQILYLQAYIEQIKKDFGAKIILCGDFNSYPKTKTINLLESFYNTSYNKDDEHQLTFHGYSDQTIGKPIDYFFTDKRLKMNAFRIIRDKNETYLSDHYPIEITVSSLT